MTIQVYGAPEGWDAILLARRAAEHNGAVLHVARGDARASRLETQLAFFAPEIEVLRFPAWDCLPYDRVSPNAQIVSERIATLSRLLEPAARPRILLTTVNALIQRVPPRATFRGAGLTLEPRARCTPTSLAAFAEANGYGRAATVMEPGEYAIRGGIIDIYPAGEPSPVRIDLFGDDIESIRRFDPTTQRSAARLDRLVLRPVGEVSLDPDSIARFRTAWRDLFGNEAARDPLYQSISDARRHPGVEHYLPLFHATTETLFDYLPNASLSFDNQDDEVLTARLEMIADHYQARKSLPRDGQTPYRALPPDRLYLSREEFDALIATQHGGFVFTPYAKPDGAPQGGAGQGPARGIDAGGRPGPIYAQTGTASAYAQLQTSADKWFADKRRVLLTAWSRGARERLVSLLREHALKAEPIDTYAALRKLPPRTIGVATVGLDRGFIAEDLAVVAEQDLLGERIARPPRRRKRADQFIAEATEIVEGDLVVHQDYGVGRYDGLETLTANNAPHECLRLLYDGGQKLFLPVENIELLSRFGAETEGVGLDKLGGAAWQTRKARAKQRIKDMAGELIRTAAERRIRTASVMAPPDGSWDEFCARFPFAETDDQQNAINDVLEDLAAGTPMDRLICGDVGFGKTEVALRAAYVAAMAGTQVAVVVPTTLLARQHTRTFAERFAGLPVRVAQLSRMVTAKDAAEVKRGLAGGTIDIVIGTHALLAKGIEFSQLGLVIIDEEQHFGVAHKEKLKALRADVHVLTLTATPIPRTLQLALTGVREMSIIATPPTDRLAVRTFIMPWDAVVIREALQRERFRGGQVFCVVPRIEDLQRMADRIATIAPDARTVQAHGRLAPTELERVMTEFGDGKYDILISTNIVESGLDMPAVNTIVIHRADMFGLGQLYQLRGRVGRGKQRGYAYLTWPTSHILSGPAEKRLNVMQTLDNLGAGFTLASHDLDIRGAGNLLGDEQSGHIREVGIELYQQMLEDAVAELKQDNRRPTAPGGAIDRDWTPNINLGLPVMIPAAYVQELPVRLGLYRRIGTLATDQETDAMAAELTDRFGKLPDEVENLLQVVALKRACRAVGVEKLEAGPKGLVVAFRHNKFENPAGLISWLATQKSAPTADLKLRPDHKLALAREMTVPQRLKAAKDILSTLNRLATPAKAA
jgi:transcription-repair coupling factor (superfamily II helicase)